MFFPDFFFGPAIGHCNKVGKGRAIACIMSFLGKLFSSKDSTSKGDEDNEDEHPDDDYEVPLRHERHRQ